LEHKQQQAAAAAETTIKKSRERHDYGKTIHTYTAHCAENSSLHSHTHTHDCLPMSSLRTSLNDEMLFYFFFRLNSVSRDAMLLFVGAAASKQANKQS